MFKNIVPAASCERCGALAPLRRHRLHDVALVLLCVQLCFKPAQWCADDVRSLDVQQMCRSAQFAIGVRSGGLRTDGRTSHASESTCGARQEIRGPTLFASTRGARGKRAGNRRGLQVPDSFSFPLKASNGCVRKKNSDPSCDLDFPVFSRGSILFILRIQSKKSSSQARQFQASQN